MGLRLVLQSRPLCPAFYAISVRRLGILPAASFRFRLTADTLAVRLTLPTTKRVVDFHPKALTEPYVNLSVHTALINHNTIRSLCRFGTVCCFPLVPPAFTVDLFLSAD